MSNSYFYNILIAVSILVNAIFAGLPHEPLSSRAWRRYKEGKPLLKKLVDGILGEHHCLIAYVEYTLSLKRNGKINGRKDEL